MSSSGRPSTPPAALISSMARTTPWCEVWPKPASLPVREANSPILIGSAACTAGVSPADRVRANRSRAGVFMGMKSGMNVLDESVVAVFDRQHDGGFGGIALGIEGDATRGALEIFRRGQGVAQLRTIGRTGAFERIDQHHRRIITQRGQ